MKTPFQICYIALGSNKGNKFDNLQKAIKFLEDDKNIRLLNVASIYESKPYGGIYQDNFLNTAVEVLTSLDPFELLQQLKEIEVLIGRENLDKWGPREIDLDIIFYENFLIDNKILKIPHPDFHLRDFVLVPLIELNDKIFDPLSAKPITYFLDKLENSFILRKINKSLSFKEKLFEKKY